MGFLGNVVGGLVKNVLPKVLPAVQNILSSPVGKVGVDILKQLASSVFSKDGKGGVFSDSFQLTLPNPLSRLNGLLGKWGEKISSIADFAGRIGDFLQGKRQLEDGQNVTLPPLSERAQASANAATALSNEIASGSHAATAVTTSASTSSSSSASTSRPSSSGGGHIFDSIDGKAYSTEFSAEENDMLSKIKDPAQRAQMEAQLKLQKYANLMQFVSNMMRIMGDISKGIIQNIR